MSGVQAAVTVRRTASICLLLLLCGAAVAVTGSIGGAWLDREHEIDDLRSRLRELASRPAARMGEPPGGGAIIWPTGLRADSVDDAQRHLQGQLRVAAADAAFQIEAIRTLPEGSRSNLVEARASFTLRNVPADTVSVLVARLERASPPILIETLRVVGRRAQTNGGLGQPAVQADPVRVELSATVGVPVIAYAAKTAQVTRP